MTATLLGCPHCRKPIGSAPRIAGQPVSCPYCRRPFQMPGRPQLVEKPADKAKPEPAPPAPPESPPAAAPVVPTARVALDPYQSVDRAATWFVRLGSAAILVAGLLVALRFVLPQFEATNERPADIATGVVGSLFVVVCVAVGIAGLVLVGALIRVGVEALRTTRVTEPEFAAKPKSE